MGDAGETVVTGADVVEATAPPPADLVTEPVEPAPEPEAPLEDAPAPEDVIPPDVVEVEEPPIPEGQMVDPVELGDEAVPAIPDDAALEALCYNDLSALAAAHGLLTEDWLADIASLKARRDGVLADVEEPLAPAGAVSETG